MGRKTRSYSLNLLNEVVTIYFKFVIYIGKDFVDDIGRDFVVIEVSSVPRYS